MSPRAHAGKSECHVSIDIETSGPCPGVHHMLSLGAAAFFEGEQVGEPFYVKIDNGEIPWDPDTYIWWQEQAVEVRAELFLGQTTPFEAMCAFAVWLDALPGERKIAVGWPITYDFAYVNYYAWTNVGRNPLGYAGVDIRSFANGIARNPMVYGLGEEEIQTLVGEIEKDGLVAHRAVDDAIGQGRLWAQLTRFCRDNPLPVAAP